MTRASLLFALLFSTLLSRGDREVLTPQQSFVPYSFPAPRTDIVLDDVAAQGPLSFDPTLDASFTFFAVPDSLPSALSRTGISSSSSSVSSAQPSPQQPSDERVLVVQSSSSSQSSTSSHSSQSSHSSPSSRPRGGSGRGGGGGVPDTSASLSSSHSSTSSPSSQSSTSSHSSTSSPSSQSSSAAPAQYEGGNYSIEYSYVGSDGNVQRVLFLFILLENGTFWIEPQMWPIEVTAAGLQDIQDFTDYFQSSPTHILVNKHIEDVLRDGIRVGSNVFVPTAFQASVVGLSAKAKRDE